MNSLIHAGVSLAIGALFWRRTGSAAAVPASLAGGVLIDVDHLLDYLVHDRAIWRAEWWDPRSHRGRRRVFLPLHSYELLAAAAWLGLARRDDTGRAFAAGYLAHLLLDQVSNPSVRPLTYFLGFRAARGFRKERIYRMPVQSSSVREEDDAADSW